MNAIVDPGLFKATHWAIEVELRDPDNNAIDMQGWVIRADLFGAKAETVLFSFNSGNTSATPAAGYIDVSRANEGIIVLNATASQHALVTVGEVRRIQLLDITTLANPTFIASGKATLAKNNEQRSAIIFDRVMGTVSSVIVGVRGPQGSQGVSAVGFSTLALLEANGAAYPINTLGSVWADGTPANNGIYAKNTAAGTGGGGSWTKQLDLSDFLNAFGAAAAVATTLVVANVDAIRDIDGVAPRSSVYAMGHTTPGDGGQGFFRWDAAATGADNDGTIVELDDIATGAGRYVRLVPDSGVTPQMFGAFGVPGGTDHTRWAAMFATEPKRVLIGGGGDFRVDPVVINWQIRIEGMPGTTVSQREAGPIGPDYVAPTYEITRSALFKFDTGSQGSEFSGALEIDGRRSALAGFVNERETRWTAIDVFADNVKLDGITAKNFDSAAINIEADYVTANNLTVENGGQGMFIGVYESATVPPAIRRKGISASNLTIRGCNNNGVQVFQHCLDVFRVEDSTFRGITITGTNGDSSGSSDSISALTVNDSIRCTWGDIKIGDWVTQMKRLGVSIVGTQFNTFDDLTVTGYSVPGFEDVSNVGLVLSNSVFVPSDVPLSGDDDSNVFTSINCTIGAFYQNYNRGRRTLESSDSVYDNVTVIGGERGFFIRNKGAKLVGCKTIGCSGNGVRIQHSDYAQSAAEPAHPYTVEVIDHTAMFCGAAGLRATEFEHLIIRGGDFRNNGTRLDFVDADRCGIQIDNLAANGKLFITGPNCEDDQAATFAHAFSFEPGQTAVEVPTDAGKYRMSLTALQPWMMRVGRRLLFKNIDGSNDVEGRVTASYFDEYEVEFDEEVTTDATGNTNNVTGTWTTNGTDPRILDGDGGNIALAELVPGMWITDGTEWRQLMDVDDDELLVDEAFTTPLSGDAISKVTIDADGVPSQNYGFSLDCSNIDSIFVHGVTARGNLILDNLYSGYAAAATAGRFRPGSVMEIEDDSHSISVGTIQTLIDFDPGGYAVMGAGARIVSGVAGGAATTWGLLITTTSNTLLETLPAGNAVAAGTERCTSVATQTRPGNARRLRIEFDAAPAVGVIKYKVRVRVDRPDGWLS